MFILAWLQGLLIFDDGVFLRGAVTIGDLHIENGIVFGQALVDAYELESQEALYPRILVDEKLFDYFDKHPELYKASHHNRTIDQEYIDEYAIVDSDGKRFIDYLNPSHITIGNDFSEILNVLQRHFDRVKEAVVENEGIVCVIEKYQWAGSYHNSVVDRYSEEEFRQYGKTKENYLLTNEDVPDVEGWTIPT